MQAVKMWNRERPHSAARSSALAAKVPRMAPERLTSRTVGAAVSGRDLPGGVKRLEMTKLNDPLKPAALPLVERRKSERLPLRLPARFMNDRASISPCFTENISSGGFYCVSPDAFVPGDHLEVEFLLPAHNLGRGEKRVRLKCQARVVRIDSTWLGPGFGIGCRIEAYSLHLEEAES